MGDVEEEKERACCDQAGGSDWFHHAGVWSC